MQIDKASPASSSTWVLCRWFTLSWSSGNTVPFSSSEEVSLMVIFFCGDTASSKVTSIQHAGCRVDTHPKVELTQRRPHVCCSPAAQRIGRLNEHRAACFGRDSGVFSKRRHHIAHGFRYPETVTLGMSFTHTSQNTPPPNSGPLCYAVFTESQQLLSGTHWRESANNEVAIHTDADRPAPAAQRKVTDKTL